MIRAGIRASRAVAAVLLALAGSVAPAAPAASGDAAAITPDVIVIVTDDQRADQLVTMPTVRERLQARGVTFSRAFAPVSLCCPSRVSILRGQHATTTGVWDIAPPYGGFELVRDLGLEDRTLATWLHDAGYRTALIGKYLNGYTRSHTAHVPPGWDEWNAFTNVAEGGGYYDFTMSVNGVERAWGSDPASYSSDVLTRRAVRFIGGTPSAQPLFLFLSYRAPHHPHTPAASLWQDPRCSSASTAGLPSFNESDVSDKPSYVRHLPLFDASEAYEIGTVVPRRMCRTLLSVDDGVGRVLDALAARGSLGSSLIVFLSDNGLMVGEHRLRGKNVPYDGSVHVPLVVRFDPVTAPLAGTVDDHMVANVDVAPTAVDAAGVTPAIAFDGSSLLELLGGGPWRTDVPIQSIGRARDAEGPWVPAYCGVEAADGWVYVRYDAASVPRPDELYDLTTDPFELENLAGRSSSAARLEAMRSRARELCGSGPPGFSWTAP